MKKRIRLWVFSVVGGAVILVILAAATFVVISGKNGKEPFIGGHCVMWVETGSMNPTIPERSYILVKKADPGEVKRGDVIVFISDDPSIKGQRNVHRVVGITEDENGNRLFTTKGDNVLTNPKNDDYPAAGKKLIGKHIKTLRFLSIMGRLLSNAVGFYIIIVVIIAVLMLIYSPEMAKVIKRADEIGNEKKKMIDELVRAAVERLKASGGIPESETAIAKENTAEQETD